MALPVEDEPARFLPTMPADSFTPLLLVAMPQLLDPNFHRTVILLVHHDEQGAFGLVLNRKTEISLREICHALEVSWGCATNAFVYWGGPVQPNTGWMLFGDGANVVDPSIVSLQAGLNFVGSIEVMNELTASPPEHFHLYLGYAGWGEGQLEAEMAQGAWLAAPVEPKWVFDAPPDELWTQVLRALGVDPVSLVATPGVH